MMKSWIWYLSGGLLLVILTGCSQINPFVEATMVPHQPTDTKLDLTDKATLLTAPAIASTTAEEATMANIPSPAIPFDPALQPLVDQAKSDLARRLEVPTEQIELVEAKPVVWPDSSLGCPQPGMEYKQVPEDGALIILQVEGIKYRYHSGGSRELFLCETVYKDPNPPPKIDIFNLTPFKPDSDSSTPDNSIPPGEDQ